MYFSRNLPSSDFLARPPCIAARPNHLLSCLRSSIPPRRPLISRAQNEQSRRARHCRRCPIPRLGRESSCRSRHRPGAPFKPEALARLAEPQKTDRARFETLGLTWQTPRSGSGNWTGNYVASQEAIRTPEAGNDSSFQNWSRGTNQLTGQSLLRNLTAAIRDFVVLSDHAAVAMALWAVHARPRPRRREDFPRLALSSPDKRCGKTTALLVMQKLVPKPLSASNITSAVLLRVVESERPTLLIDEADTFLKGNEELRGILNSGHNRDLASVWRTVGEDHEPRRFDTWAPVAVAMIGRLPDTLADRSIEIDMRRKRPTDEVKKFRADKIRPPRRS